MHWGRKFLVVAVALAGGQFVASSGLKALNEANRDARHYTLGFDHDTGVFGTPGVQSTGEGIRAGTIAIGREGGSLGSAVAAIASDIGGGRVAQLTGPNSFTPFGAEWKGGVNLSAGNTNDVAGDEFVVGQATGGSLVRTYPLTANGDATASTSFQAFEDGFKGGVRTAVADVDGNGTNEIVVAPGPGRAPTVKVFTPSGTLVSSGDVFASSFTGGVFVAAANLDNDAATELVVGAGASGGPHVRILNGLTEAISFFAFEPAAANGVRVGAGTIDGVASVVATTRTGAGNVVRVFKPDGTASSVASIAASDGFLSVTVAEGNIHLLDAAPRLTGISGGDSVRTHTRNVVQVYGAGLPQLLDQISLGDEANPGVIYDLTEFEDNDMLMSFGVPNDTPAPGSMPLRVVVRTPGGTATHTLQLGIPITGPSPARASLVSTGVVGGGPHVRAFAESGLRREFMAGDPTASSGVRIARSDLDSDGTDEFVLAHGRGHAALVEIRSGGGAQLDEFPAYANFDGGVFVAAGEVDPEHDGAEIVTGADAGGGPHVKIFNADGAEVGGFMAYEPGFTGGVRVAVADVDSDGVAEIVTAPGPGGGPHVRVFTADGTEVGGFMAYEPGFTGGIFVAGADVDGDAFDEVVTGPGAGGGPHVRVFTEDGAEVGGFMAYEPGFTGGVSVGRVGDDILGPNLVATAPGPGGGPHVRIFTPDGDEVDAFMAYAPTFTGGVFVAGGIA